MTRGRTRVRGARRVVALASVVLAVALSAAGCWFLGGDVVVRLSEAQVQTALDLRFPVAKTYLGRLSLAYHDPEVQLAEGSDRIGVGMSFTLSVGSEEDHRAYSGRAHLTAGIGYDPDSALVMLHEPVLDSLSLGQLQVGYVEQASELARRLALERLDRIPVYYLKEEGFVLGAAALILEDVTVEDGRLIVTLGRPH